LRLASLFFFRYPISFNNEYCEYPTYWYRLSTRSIKITKNEALDDCDASTWLEPAGDEGDECDEGEGEESQSWWSKNWSDWSNSSTSNPRNVTNQWNGWNETDETWTWKQDGWKVPRCFASAQGFQSVGSGKPKTWGLFGDRSTILTKPCGGALGQAWQCSCWHVFVDATSPIHWNMLELMQIACS